MKQATTLYDAYDTVDNKYLVKAENRHVVAEKIGITVSEFKNYVGKKNRCRKRYLIVKTGRKVDYDWKHIRTDFTEMPKSFCDEWERVRRMFLHSC